MTTMGKYRHLSRTSTQAGHFVVIAIDHRAVLLDKLNDVSPQPLTDAQFTAFKAQVLEHLAPESSAVLADPAYGLGHGIASGVLNRQVGLMSPVEVTDYDAHPSLREVNFIPRWSVQKIKMMGGDGVKMLLPYHPKAQGVEVRLERVQQIIDDCATYDIPFFLEPIPHALNAGDTLSNAELLDVSLEMCERFSKMGADVLKLPFPVDAKQSDDENGWATACQQVNDACSVPWALLSAGVNFDTFLRQSWVACQAGASGVIVGRAVWAEAVDFQGDKRAEFLRTTAIERLRALAHVCDDHATPWTARVKQPEHSVNWYESY